MILRKLHRNIELVSTLTLFNQPAPSVFVHETQRRKDGKNSEGKKYS
jgi:hypothetical protein